MSKRPMSLVAAAALLCVGLSFTSAADEPPTVVRVYDVADLLDVASPTPPAPNSERGGGGGGQIFGGATPPATADDSGRENLAALVRETVGVGTWRLDGGSNGSLRFTPNGTGLVVVQTEAVHTQIRELLDQLRRLQADTPSLRVRVDFVVLNAADTRPTTRPTAEADASAFARSTPYATAEAVGFNGRPMHFDTGRDRPVVKDVNPVVAPGSVAYAPTVETQHTGVSVGLVPRLVPGANTVVVNLVGHLAEEQPQPAPATQPATGDTLTDNAAATLAAVTRTIDRNAVLNQKLSTVARLPIGRRVQVATLTLPAAVPGGASRSVGVWVRVDPAP